MYKLKKINAALSLVTAVVLLVHAGSMSLLLLGAISFKPWVNQVAHLFATIFMIHIVLVFLIFFFSRDRGEALKYKKLNKETIIQRATGLLILILIHFHFNSISTKSVDGSVVIVQPSVSMFALGAVLFICVFQHTNVSLAKAIVTLELMKSEKQHKLTKIISSVVFSIATIFAVVSLAVYCFK